MKNFTELYNSLDNNKIDYLEIFNEFVPRTEEPYFCIGAVEDIGEGWLFTWGAGGDSRIYPKELQFVTMDIAEIVSRVFYLARGDIRLVKVIPLKDKDRNWTFVSVGG